MKSKTQRIISSSEPSNIDQTGKEISQEVWKEVPTGVEEMPGEDAKCPERQDSISNTIFRIRRFSLKFWLVVKEFHFVRK